MKVIIGCEFSGRVRDAFTAKGHYAISCDLLPTESPGMHYQGNVLDRLDDGWDMGIFHPPCTYITTTANRAFINNPNRWQKRVDAINFIWALMNCKIQKICIENPKGVIVSHIKHPDFGKPQYIQPYYFGHKDSKMTGLWLKNLSKLKPTNIIEPEWVTDKLKRRRYSKTAWSCSSTNSEANRRLRNLTYQNIANAFADQWG